MDANTITAITPEVRMELSAIFQQEMEIREQQKRDNRTAYRRVFKEFEEDMKRFDYTDTTKVIRPTGETVVYTYDHAMCWKVKNAIGTLLRAVYQASSVEHIPSDKEPDMRDFVRKVLALMEEKKSAAADGTATMD